MISTPIHVFMGFYVWYFTKPVQVTDYFPILISLGECHTILSAYTSYRHLDIIALIQRFILQV